MYKVIGQVKFRSASICQGHTVEQWVNVSERSESRWCESWQSNMKLDLKDKDHNCPSKLQHPLRGGGTRRSSARRSSHRWWEGIVNIIIAANDNGTQMMSFFSAHLPSAAMPGARRDSHSVLNSADCCFSCKMCNKICRAEH